MDKSQCVSLNDQGTSPNVGHGFRLCFNTWTNQWYMLVWMWASTTPTFVWISCCCYSGRWIQRQHLCKAYRKPIPILSVQMYLHICTMWIVIVKIPVIATSFASFLWLKCKGCRLQLKDLNHALLWYQWTWCFFFPIYCCGDKTLPTNKQYLIRVLSCSVQRAAGLVILALGQEDPMHSCTVKRAFNYERN
jgi:hypothetical protein